MKVKEQRKKTITVLLFILLCSIGIGYAFLRTNLTINGTGKIRGNTWDIHFENLNVTEGSVELSTGNVGAAIQSSRTDITYTITLNEPGDYYEFTVDAVNSGTINGMVDSVTSKLNDTPITTLPSYLEYSVTYESDDEIELKHILEAGDSETYKVRLAYKKDISANDLPTTPQSLTLDFGVVYVQADSNAITPIHPVSLYSVLENEAKSNGLAREYTGEHKDSFTKPATKKIYHWYASTNNEGTAITNKNNLIFAGFCWQMIRTTDTGGIKIIYNGISNDGKCNNSGEATSIGTSSFNLNGGFDSIAYAGYMYNPDTIVRGHETDYYGIGNSFGADVVYENGKYIITGELVPFDDYHHYTCKNDSGICSDVRYYFFNKSYTTLTDGRNMSEALNDMLYSDDVNQTNSAIKTVIDNWYQENLSSYTGKLEDTIFCNDRSFYDIGGLNPHGGNSQDGRTLFKNYNDNTDLSCELITDQFSVSNNKAQLIYPVALMSGPEMTLMNSDSSRSGGQDYWLLSPASFPSTVSKFVTSGGSFWTHPITTSHSVRPAVSLAPGTKYTTGDGSKDNPYIVN